MSEKTKNCPFCGSNTKVSIYDASFGSIQSYHVFCKKCLCKGPHGITLEEAINKWNTRPENEQE